MTVGNSATAARPTTPPRTRPRRDKDSRRTRSSERPSPSLLEPSSTTATSSVGVGTPSRHHSTVNRPISGIVQADPLLPFLSSVAIKHASSLTTQVTPVTIMIDRSPAVDVSVGDHHTCAILDNGLLKCWGRDDYGQLGDGSSTYGRQGDGDPLVEPSIFPIDLGPGRPPSRFLPATSLPAPSSTAARSSAGAWGLARRYRWRQWYLPAHDRTLIHAHRPRCRSKPSRFQVAATTPASPSTMATSSAGAKTRTGKSAMRAIPASITRFHRPSRAASPGSSPAMRARPSAPPSSRIPATSSQPDRHNCALRDDGQPFCWGSSQHGQLGIGEAQSGYYCFPTPTRSSTPPTSRRSALAAFTPAPSARMAP